MSHLNDIENYINLEPFTVKTNSDSVLKIWKTIAGQFPGLIKGCINIQLVGSTISTLPERKQIDNDAPKAKNRREISLVFSCSFADIGTRPLKSN